MLPFTEHMSGCNGRHRYTSRILCVLISCVKCLVFVYTFIGIIQINYRLTQERAILFLIYLLLCYNYIACWFMSIKILYPEGSEGNVGFSLSVFHQPSWKKCLHEGGVCQLRGWSMRVGGTLLCEKMVDMNAARLLFLCDVISATHTQAHAHAVTNGHLSRTIMRWRWRPASSNI
jgi:hypothetical protein